MRNFLVIPVCLLTMLCAVVCNAQPKQTKANGEVIYHIFQRSFYDSNGDLHGDLNGIHQKLDYLQNLGVNAILLTPLYESVFYHNYFASDFKKIDPRYGTLNDYLALIKDVHKRGMKLYMDMETQYVTEDHIWWKDGVGNLQSKYSDYILYADDQHKKPSTIVMNLDGLKGYDDVYRRITTVNLNSDKVKDYNYQLFKYWMDPNGDGKFDDGVDGFRLDHMMDNLDGKLPNLFANFWVPLVQKLKTINPRINIVAEQAQWASLGIDYLKNGGADRVFAFRIMGAIRSFDKKQLVSAADSTFSKTPADKQQVVFIENHDVPRFSYGVKGDLQKLKLGAALNLLIGGVPSIYYGQEIGMTGTSANLGPTDANEVPNRQAFEWYKTDQGKGMAYWYKNSEVGRKVNNDIANDGISLEEEQNDPNSLWNFYRAMIGLRNSTPAFSKGGYKTLNNNNEKVFSFERATDSEKVLVAMNLSGIEQEAQITIPAIGKVKQLYGANGAELKSNGLLVKLPAYGLVVLKTE